MRLGASATGALLVLTTSWGLPAELPGAAAEELSASITRPLQPDYRIHADGSVTLRLCFNWSCASRQNLTFTATDMTGVVRQMALCSGDGLHDRLQRLRIGIWQMEDLAEKYQPLLANDEAVNNRDQERGGRMDCVDNASNTTTFLHVLRDLGLLPGWSIAAPRVRNRFSMLVHWTAVVVDRQNPESWSVDAWFRPNGHLPFVMPLADWVSGRIAWEAPFAVWNPSPRYSNQLCVRPVPVHRTHLVEQQERGHLGQDSAE
jgi:hypothetical protein